MPYDIAVNITDDQYLGQYHGRKKHPCDISSVIDRAISKGIRMVFLGISVSTSVESAALACKYGQFAAVGIHPGSASEATEQDIRAIKDLASGKKVNEQQGREEILLIEQGAPLHEGGQIVAVGEIGLDYYRDYAPREKQKKVFARILEETSGLGMPYILHYRDCEEDFHEIAGRHRIEGVVHSYTGTQQEMERLLEKGYYIGVNGASIRENEHTHVIERIPQDRLLIETDAPWCSIRKTSKYAAAIESYLRVSKRWKEGDGVKGRNEPVNLLEVIDAVAEIRKISREEVVRTTDENFCRLFRVERQECAQESMQNT